MMLVPCRSLIIVALLLFSLFFYFFSVPVKGVQLNIFALCFLIGVALYLLFDIARSWVFFLYIFGLVLSVFANVIAELSSSYMIEVQEYAFPTGGGARNSFLVAFFLCGIFVSFRCVVGCFSIKLKRALVVELLLIQCFVFLGWLLVAYMMFVVFRYGSPLVMGLDRFAYWANIAPPGYRYITSLVPILGFVVSYAREIGFLRNSFAFLWLLLAIFFLILGGEKFSGLLILFFFYLLPFFCMSNRRLSTGFVVLASVVFLALAGMILLNYYLIYGSAFLDIFEARIVLQGQMLFALDAISSTGVTGGNSSLRGFWGTDEGEEGIRYLMYQIAPLEVVDRYLEGGATFTSPFPANLNYFFGMYSSPIVVSIFSILVGTCGGVLYVALRGRAFLLSLVSLKAFFYIYLAVVMGETQALLDWKMAVYVAAVLFLVLISICRIDESEREIDGVVSRI